ncbi:MAG: RidA family protein [Patescibacteria group bacterium]|jgi:enamine deaminase RidA (YjgF/YER057c/UK114 family)
MPKKQKPAGILAMESVGQPFSTCVQIGNHFHFSGTVGRVVDGRVVGDLEEQIEEIFTKMDSMLGVCELYPDDVFSATILLAGDMSGYGLVNTSWNLFFRSAEIMPRRKAYAVSALPFDALIEIEFDAVKQD